MYNIFIAYVILAASSPVILIGVLAREGAGVQPPPETRKRIFLGQLLNFSRSSQQPKNEKEVILLHLLNDKMKFILSSEIRAF